MRVGNIVKCLDFPGRPDCFIIGEVIELRDDTFIVKTSMRAHLGHVIDGAAGYQFEVPMPGKALFDSADRITVLV